MTDSRINVEALLADTEWVRRLASRLLGDFQRAEDVTQEVLVAALERQGGASEPLRRPRAWLARVTRNLAFRQVEQRAQRDHHELRAVQPEDLEPESSCLERMQIHQQVVTAVGELDEPYRTAIGMRFFDDLTAGQIAERLGIQPATVRKRVSRGIEQLRARLDREHHGDRGAWCLGLAALVERGGSGLGTKALVGAGVTTMAAVKWGATGAMMLGLAIFAGQRMADGPQGPAASAPTGEEREMAELAQADARAELRRDAGESGSRAAVPAPAPGLLPVVVTHHGGAPVAGARLVWVDAQGEVVFAERLDDHGRAPVPVDPSAGGQLGVLGATPAPYWVALTASKGDAAVHLQLPEGVEVEGRVLVDGAPPAGSFELGLSAAARGTGEERLDASVASFLAPRGDRFPIGLLVRSSGGYHFSALPEGGSARLQIPEGYRLEEGESLELQGAGVGRDLRLRRVAVIRGRALRADGSVVSGVNFDYEQTRLRDGREFETAQGGGRGRGNGVFEMEAITQMSEMRLTLRDGEGRTRRLVLSEADLWPLEQRRDVELGDVVLREVEPLHLLVLDAMGEPVEGARATSPQEPEWESDPASSAGILEPWGLTAAAVELDLRAFGFHEKRIARPVGTSSDEPLRVVLERAPVLTVSVSPGPEVTAQELAESKLHLRVRAEQPLFEGGWSVPDWRRWSAGGSRIVASPEGWGWILLGPREGELRLSGLVSGVPFAIELRDKAGFLLGEQRSVGRGASGATVEFRVERAPVSLRGRVVDSQGQGLERVNIRARVAGDEGASRAKSDSDAHGEFELHGLFGDVLELDFQKRGYVALTESSWPVRSSGAVWVLEEAVELSVAAEAEDGRALVIERIEVLEIGSEADARPIATSDPSRVYVLGSEVDMLAPTVEDVPALEIEGVPRRSVKLRLWINGHEIEREHDARESSVRLQISDLEWGG